MPSSIKLGKLFGVNVEVDSLAAIFILLATLLVGTYFFLIIYLYVLIHELLHSITSLRNNVKVNRIILTLFGGASVIDTVNIDPKIEFRIAVVGPIGSLLLGGISGIFAVLSQPGSMAQFWQASFIINIILGVSNILPAFPLDGGRVFRSYLERKYGYMRATLMTVKAGNYIMAFIVLGSIYFLVFGATHYSLYYKELVFVTNFIIASFIYVGAQSEKESAIVRSETSGIKVKDALDKKFAYLPCSTSLNTVYEKVRKTKMHVVLTKLKDDYAIADFSNFKKEGIKNLEDISVKIPSISPNTNISDAMQSISSTDMGVAAVVSKGKLLGVTSIRTIQTLITLLLMKKKNKIHF